MANRTFLTTHFVLWIAVLSYGQLPLITVDTARISSEDFLYLYNKNNYYQDSLSHQESIQKYLDLFINFKLKVMHAYRLGIHQTESYQQEISKYRQQLAEPYLTNSNRGDSLLREAYSRALEEVKISHLLIRINQDTATALQRISDLRERILAGADFNELAFAESEDPSARRNKGMLGYITVFRTVYPFETAAYATPVGEVSEPVLSNYGFHLVKVHDKRPSRGKVQVSQILVRKESDSVISQKRLDEIYEALNQGESWEALCAQYSGDPSTRTKGGRLPWFTTGQMFPEFEDVAFGLDTIGQISRPLKADYGWHIIKLDGKKPIGTFEESRSWLEMMIRRDPRSQIPYLDMIQELKRTNNYQSSPYADTLLSKLGNRLSEPNQVLEGNDTNTLFWIQEQRYSAEDFASYLAENPNTGRSYQESFRMFENKSVMEFEEEHLEEKYPEFRRLYQEYREGILLFELMQDQVWGPAVEDSLGLQRFFEENRNNYSLQEVEVLVAAHPDRNVLEDILAAWQQITRSDSPGDGLGSLSEGDWSELINGKNSLEVSFEHDTFVTGSEPFPLPKPLESGSCHFITSHGSDKLVMIGKVHPARAQDLGAIKGSVISDYQDYLDRQLVRDLRNRYSYSVDKKELKKVIKRIENL